MIGHSHAFDFVRRMVSGLLAIALVSFAWACAAHVGACDTAAAIDTAHSIAVVHTGDCCPDRHGCTDRPAGGTEQVASCCSTWAPAPVAPGVPGPPVAVSPSPAPPASLTPDGILASALTPIPAESPPPIVSVLRL
jgi:hypothetical protein